MPNENKNELNLIMINLLPAVSIASCCIDSVHPQTSRGLRRPGILQQTRSIIPSPMHEVKKGSPLSRVQLSVTHFTIKWKIYELKVSSSSKK